MENKLSLGFAALWVLFICLFVFFCSGLGHGSCTVEKDDNEPSGGLHHTPSIPVEARECVSSPVSSW